MVNKQSLGQFLRTIREGKGLSLRAVESASGVSNAYLSQLESDKIRQPSPVVLHKLSEVFEISYTRLLSLAGYPVPDANRSLADDVGIAARIGQVSTEEEDALVEYLEFLRARRDRRKTKK
jgi:HTH-type transcriptional regulator, competence development regulator